MAAVTIRNSGVATVRQRLAAGWKASAGRLGMLAAGAVLLLFLPLLILRIYQSALVEELLQGYEEAHLEALRTTAMYRDESLVLLEAKDFLVPLPTRPSQNLGVGYLAVEILADSCDSERISFTLRYGPGAKEDYSRTIQEDLTGRSSTKIFAPIYSRERSLYLDSPFLGVELKPEMLGCLKLSRVSDLHRFPPILYITLHDDWRERTLYQTMVTVPGWKDFKLTLLHVTHRWIKILSEFSKNKNRRAVAVAIEIPALIFADDFETGSLDRWR